MVTYSCCILFFFFFVLLFFLIVRLRIPHSAAQRHFARLDKFPGLLLRIDNGNVMLQLGVGIVFGLAAQEVHFRVR